MLDLRRLALVIFAAVLPASAGAQGWPTRPVHMIIPAGPGGPIDSIMRPVAQSLSEAFGQQFIVENRGGGEGVIAAEACAKATPDGYFLCGVTKAVAIYGPVLHRNLSYDPERDFTPVAYLGEFDAAIVVHPSVPANTIAELIEYAKSKPNAVTFANFGANTPSYFYMEWFRKVRGAPFLGVPYKTAVQSQTAVVAGEVMVNYFGATQSAAMVKAGRLKALAVSSDERLPYLPGVPTFREAGIDLHISLWNGLLAPKGTPRDVVQRVNAHIVKTMSDPQFAAKFLTRLGVKPVNMTPEQFGAMMRRETADFAELAKTLGLKVQ